MNKRNRLTLYILVGLVLGIVVGYIAYINLADPKAFAANPADFLGVADLRDTDDERGEHQRRDDHFNQARYWRSSSTWKRASRPQSYRW